MPKKVRQAIRLKKVKEHQTKLLELEADLEKELNQTDSEDEFAEVDAQPQPMLAHGNDYDYEEEKNEVHDYATEGSAHSSDYN